MTPVLPPDTDPPVRHLAFKAGALIVLLLTLLLGSVAYVLHARGVFEPTQRVVLVADDSEGVSVGMDMTFAGFAIGRVARIELADDGRARILVDVPRADARWLRTSSIFTLERSLVGGTRLRAYSGVLDDPPLPDGAERSVLRGDAAAEIPQLTAAVRELLGNLNALTRSDAALARSLDHVEVATGRLAGPQGMAGMVTGNEADARRLLQAIERSNALLARLDSLVANADRQVFGQGQPTGPDGRPAGLVGDVRATVRQLDALLADTRGSLQKLDAVLVEAQGVAANTREATTDLTALRAEVEASLRRVDGLILDLNRRWPFARDAEVKLP
jgi:phospholipid/cholesterol/gamma-HCH transport system substrate-binding protein